ncbi:hypothetical protein CPB84DRAFT_1849021 [Gymnopilus junonius]|uniref:G domain-containing protein n=1 Tax=Gymnopilus junonius TaxID=109634 RepID=A0A9P5NKL3_GYMJU|nr:hypothetical protein CPB84DRAFT_1849021 [Gymnopilus junonius]
MSVYFVLYRPEKVHTSDTSKLIDMLTGQQTSLAGAPLESCTQAVSAIRVKKHPVHKDHIILLDTPGFDDTFKSDFQILQMISDWLVEIYKKKARLTGILYLHRITDNRMAGSPHRNLRMFGDLCGDKAARNVVLVTTMWDKLRSRDIGDRRQEELERNFWNPMIKNGATTTQFENTVQAAWEIIDNVIIRRNEGVALLLQEEIVDLKLRLEETKAGREVYATLQALQSKQKETLEQLANRAATEDDKKIAAELHEELRNLQKELEKTFKEMQKLHIPLGRKVAMFFNRKTKAKRKKLAPAPA